MQYLQRVYGQSSGSSLNMEAGGNSNYHFSASIQQNTCWESHSHSATLKTSNC